MGFIASVFGYLLNGLYTVFNNYGIAIIIFTVIIRLILIPITIKQQKTMKKSEKLQAEMKNNPEKLNQETIELYKREKMSPFSGCLTAIVQILLILSVFWLVSQPLTYMKKVDTNLVNEYKKTIQEANNGTSPGYIEIEIINKVGPQDERVNINMDFLGLDLSKVPSSNLNDWRVYIIPILYIMSSIISIKLTTKATNKKKEKTKLIGDGEKKEPDEMEALNQMSKNMSYMLPIMSVMIAFIAPLGLAMYWLISNVLMMIERLVMDKIMKHKEESENV